MTRLQRFEVAAWIAGFALLGAYASARAWYAYSYEAALASFYEVQNIADVAFVQASDSQIDTSSWSPARVARYQESLRNPVAPVALLRIPALGLSVPVFEGTSEKNLNRGAGRIAGTARIGEHGNVGIAAHRDGFFRALQGVRIGHVLIIERPTTTETYRVVASSIVEPSNVSVLSRTAKRSVTLVTCYPFYYVGSAPQRFIVRAEIVSEGEHRSAPALARAN